MSEPAAVEQRQETAAAKGGDASDVVISVKGLVSRFGDHLIHDGLDLEVKRGEVLGLVGGSGAGKSVLLNTLIGLKEPDGGQVKVFDVDIAHASDRAMAGVDRRWGVLFQGGALFSSLTVRENVAAPMHEHTRLSKKLADELADLRIALAGLPPESATLRPAELSGGMKKRAALARALALDPDLLFLDEPTAGLDPIGAEQFDKLIRDLSDALGLTVFMITHDLDSLYAITDRIAVIADKKVVATGPVQELEKSDHPWIKEYFLGPRGRAAGKAEAADGRAPEPDARAAPDPRSGPLALTKQGASAAVAPKGDMRPQQPADQRSETAPLTTPETTPKTAPETADGAA